MSILKANLRHLYQRRGLWLVYVLLGGFAPVTIKAVLEGEFMGLVGLAGAVGVLMAVLQMAILTKPFAFCLPGHRQVVRKFIFSIAVISSLTSGTVFLFYPGVPAGYVPVVLCSAFFAGLIFYLAGVWAAFRLDYPIAFIGFAGFAILLGVGFDVHVPLERAIVTEPWLVTTLGLVAAVAMWFHLGDENLARKHCLRSWIGFGTAFTPEKARRLHKEKLGERRWERLKDHPRPWVQEWFLRRMDRQGPFSTWRFVWGSLYTTYAAWMSQWRSMLLATLILSIGLGYVGARLGVFVLSQPMMMMMFMHRRPALYSAMLIAGGRDQRLFSTLAIAVVGWVLLTLVIGLAVLASIPLAVILTAIVPDIEYRGLTVHYQTIGPSVFWVLVVLPLMSLIHLAFFKTPVGMGVFVVLLYVFLLMFLGTPRPPVTLAASPQDAIALTVVLWAAFVCVLARFARTKSLVK